MQADFHDVVEKIYAPAFKVSRPAGRNSRIPSGFEQRPGLQEAQQPAAGDRFTLSNAPFGRQFDTDASAIMMVGAEDTIEFANDAARRAYDVEAGDAIETLPFEAESCEALSASVRCCAADLRERIVQLDRMNSGGALLVILSPLRLPDGRNPLVQLRCSDFVWPRRLDAILSSSFDLTRAEMEIAAFVVEGFSVARIAEARGSSVATVRCQLRTIYEKTSVNSQIELMRVVMGIVIAFATMAPAMVHESPAD